MKTNPLAKKPKSESSKLQHAIATDLDFLSLLGQFGKANYDMGSRENKGRPEPTDITSVERSRLALLDYIRTGERK